MIELKVALAWHSAATVTGQKSKDLRGVISRTIENTCVDEPPVCKAQD